MRDLRPSLVARVPEIGFVGGFKGLAAAHAGFLVAIKVEMTPAPRTICPPIEHGCTGLPAVARDMAGFATVEARPLFPRQLFLLAISVGVTFTAAIDAA